MQEEENILGYLAGLSYEDIMLQKGGGGQNISGRVVLHVFYRRTLYFRRGTSIFQVEKSCMCFIGHNIVGGGQQQIGRVILHVFHRGTLYCRGGQNI